MRFVLVHGAFHGAWCWERLIPEFESRGHTVVSFDLPGSGRRVVEDASLNAYRSAVLEHLETGDVLVGHSFGSLAMTLAADAAPEKIAHLVYLTAKLPTEGKSMAGVTPVGALLSGAMLRTGAMVSKVLPDRVMPVKVLDGGRSLRLVSESAATKRFFHDCDPQVIQWALQHLTPQKVAPMQEPVSTPNFWKSEIPRSLIVARDDRVPSPVEKIADRLGVDPFWIDGSHSPLLSRPSECAELIIDSLNRPPIGPLKAM